MNFRSMHAMRVCVCSDESRVTDTRCRCADWQGAKWRHRSRANACHDSLEPMASLHCHLAVRCRTYCSNLSTQMLDLLISVRSVVWCLYLPLHIK